MSSINDLTRLFFCSLISFLMITNSIASATDPRTLYTREDLVLISSSMNAKTYSYADLISIYQKFDTKKAKDLESFIAANPNHQTITSAKSTLEDNNLGFLVEGKKALVTLYKTGEMQIGFENKKIMLNHSMTMEQMEKVISASLNENHFSFTGFFIEDAYAVSTVVGVVLFIATFVYVMRNAHRLDTIDAISNIDTMCREYKNMTYEEWKDGLQNSMLEVRDAYEKLTTIYLQNCNKESSKLKAMCDSVPSLKKCVSGILDKADKFSKGVVNNSSRSYTKEKTESDGSPKQSHSNAVQK